MRNPYIYGYLPLITILLFSLTFGMYAVGESLQIFQSIGVYSGMREFLSDFELRVFLLIVFAVIFFMVFSALKLVGETIHELGMLFFSKDQDGATVSQARGGYIILLVGAICSAFAIQFIYVLVGIFVLTIFIYFIYLIYKMSHFMPMSGTIGLLVFELFMWTILLSLLVYVILKLYNGILASLPFAS
ncbi:DUF5366 family protein [Lysinibacillus pakistanensis]|uniref:DUF5366 family protein n=1 Tax=Lysinibacillus pakistanensis TaxID=759811 RepID=A0AAX3WTV6_9BACI|nr:DUF5366 family protein [Lysinibacillus pakistanensis]MDM5230048.1 DUF5366 family protein [Lysinibacillus pakistanensis]QGG52855.1 hypothetical protein GDS87_18985 [Lysinibacillus pakistanensis]WHY45646.1 DUF5366 family protein [Lysinibacillus pakistanensis]WHY50654.1 DUF5366 family protein [Lysinibacillus pakistanensis]